MKIEELKNYKKILIAGYGIEGKSSHAFLQKFHPDAEITITDKKDGENYLAHQESFDLLIKTPGISKDLIKIPYTTATNIFFAECNNKIIGITGTKGKSTTSQLVYQFFKDQHKDVLLAGNIGLPMLDILTNESLTSNHIVILELSSYQLDDIEYSPHISIILNIEEAHLDYHKTFEAYKNAKLHIVHESTEDDFYLYNANNPLLVNVETKAKKIAFINAGFTTEGFHQDTIDAVCTLAGLFEYSLDDVKKTIAHFVHLPHRLQNLGQFNGITFVDDSASTVPSATIFALQTLKNVDTLICGGLSRNHSFDLLAQAIIKAGLRNLIIFPDIDAALIKALGPESSNLNILSTSSMKEAVEYSFNQTQNGKICLLSPGFASYNMYSGFPERGTDFQQKIKECSSEYETTSQT